MSEMAALWVQSQSIVSAYITANVIDLHHAEDLIQDVAKAVAEKFDAFDRSRPFTPWVLGIARISCCFFVVVNRISVTRVNTRGAGL